MRQVYFLDLQSEDVASDYDDWHRPGRVPAAVLHDIRASGVAAMEIYRCGDRFVLVSDTPGPEMATDRIASQASRDWERLMDQYQRPLPHVLQGGKWAEAARMFSLDEHENEG